MQFVEKKIPKQTTFFNTLNMISKREKKINIK